MVVPVRNEEAAVEQLVDSIRRQWYRPDEVLVVDGGSTDRTVELLKSASERLPCLRVIEASEATPGRGRNLGIEAARNDWIALTDAGIDLDQHWLERLVRTAVGDSAVEIVYGAYEPSRRSRFERAAEIAYVAPADTTELGPVRTRFIASCLLRKEVWSRVGGFPDLRAAEDRIFMRSVEASGAVTRVAPEARITWQVQPTPAKTFARFRSYSRHNVVAGEQANWHYGVARQYLAALVVLAVARLARRRSIATALPVGAAARVLLTIVRRREGRGWDWVLRPDQFVAVAGVLALLDAATFLGWIEGVIDLRRRRAG
jgi:glycosyltransferase involved in cell wall biosynthesis